MAFIDDLLAESQPAAGPSSDPVAGFGTAIAGGGYGGLTPEESRLAGYRALLAAGATMLGNSGYSVRPRSFGEILATGVGAAGQSMVGSEELAAGRRAGALDAYVKLQDLGIRARNAATNEGLLGVQQTEARVKLLTAIRTLQQLGASQAVIDSILNGGDGSDVAAPPIPGLDLSGANNIKIDSAVPAAAQPLMKTIALLESGGDPRKAVDGSTIATLDEFPMIKGITTAAGPSHAVGKYQFQPDTWKETAASTGLLTFGEGNQDRNAWALAQSRYNKATGRDLLADLGDQARLPEIFKTLAPTWPSLAKAASQAGGGRVQVAGPGAGTPTVLTPPATPPAAADALPTPPLPPPTDQIPAPGTQTAPAPDAPPSPPEPPPPPPDTPGPTMDDIDKGRSSARLTAELARINSEAAAQRKLVEQQYQPILRAARNTDPAGATAALEARQKAIAQVEADRQKQEAAARLAEQNERAALIENRNKIGQINQQSDNIDVQETRKESGVRATAAQDILPILDQLEAQIPARLEQGRDYLAENAPWLRTIAASLGIGNANDQTKWRAQDLFTQTMANLKARAQQGFKGAVSDFEYRQALAQFDNLATDPRNLPLAIGFARAIQNYVLDVDKATRDFTGANRTTAGLRDYLDKTVGRSPFQRPPPLTYTREGLSDAERQQRFAADQQAQQAYLDKLGTNDGKPFLKWDAPDVLVDGRLAKGAPVMHWVMYDPSGRVIEQPLPESREVTAAKKRLEDKRRREGGG